MAAGDPYRIKRFTIDTGSWTAIVVPVPISCNRVTMENGGFDSDIKIRTDSADPLTESVIPNGSMKTIPGGAPTGMQFIPGTTVCFAQAVSGTGPLVVEFVR